jgi:DNA replication protein DnaC
MNYANAKGRMEHKEHSMLSEQMIRAIQQRTGVDWATAELIAVGQIENDTTQSPMVALADCLKASSLPSFAARQLPTLPALLNPVEAQQPAKCRPSYGCQLCNGAGFFKEAVPFGHPNFGKLFPCRCLLAAREQRAAQLLDELSSQLQRYHRCTLENFNGERPITGILTWNGHEFSSSQQQAALQQALEQARSYAQQPIGWLYLYGPPGSGKTRLAASIANAFRSRNIQATYGRVQALLDWLKAGFREDASSSYEQRLHALSQTPLLILDDLGTEQGTPWERVVLENLLNERYNRELPTILTSNLWRDELHPLIADRIAEMAQTVWLIVGSHRRLGLYEATQPSQSIPTADPWDRGEGER